MKKKFSLERIRYRLDCIMSRGPIAMSMLLFAITAAIVVLIGVIAYFVAGDSNIFYQIWISLMHTLDTGALGANATNNVPYLILMCVATLCGMFVTSILIGVITTGVESKLGDLRKGKSVVQEQGHTVIIGYDNSVFDILRELIEANSNKKDACVVVLGEQPKEEMEDAIAERIPDWNTTRIICRSGGLHELYCLQLCSIEASRSVIVNIHQDAETVKTLLALSTYVKEKTLVYPQLRYIVSLRDPQYVEAAEIAGEGRAQIIYAKDAIARIIANTCRQHGLSQVLTELFNFVGNEMYFERIPDMVGKTFRQAMLCFSNAVVCGIYTDDKVRLNPPMDTVIGEKDLLILFEKDDGAYKLHAPKSVENTHICNTASISAQACDHLVVLGSNDKLPIVMKEYNQYVQPDTKVVIVDDDLDTATLPECENLNISVCTQPVTKGFLTSLLDKNTNNILLLNDDSQSPEQSDSQTLLRLILLRDIADKTNQRFSITTEMRSIDNQRLASQARVDDFVIGSNFASLLMAQISENPLMSPLITELLDESGSELYMKPVKNYVQTGVEVDSYTLTESAARKGEIYLGYRHMDQVRSKVIVNPNKDETIVFGPEDQIVVIAEN